MPRVRKFGTSESQVYSTRLPVEVVRAIRQHGLQDRIAETIIRAVNRLKKNRPAG